MENKYLFGPMVLGDGLIHDLRRLNPWWEGKPMPVLPKTRRHLVASIHRLLKLKLAPIVAIRGPRQIGKTVAQLQVLSDMLEKGARPSHIFRVQFDDIGGISGLKEPILRLVDWYETAILKMALNEAAGRNEPAYLFFDEVQNVPEWAPQLKFLVDASTVQVVVTGSSALRIELGRDSLAGRMSTIESGVLSLTEIAGFHDLAAPGPFLPDNGLDRIASREFWLDLVNHGVRHRETRDRAFKWFSDRGGYPLVHQKMEASWADLAGQLNETVIRRVIEHDLRVGERGRKRDAPLLEEVFRQACRYTGQSPDLLTLVREVQRTLRANVGSRRVNHYLRFLADTLLIRLIQPLEIRLKRKRGSAKICLADHGLRASWLQEIVPIAPGDLEEQPHLAGGLAGHVVEGVAGTLFSTIPGLGVAHLPERKGEPEIDFVLTVGAVRIPVEVRYQRTIDPVRDTYGLKTFIEKAVNNAPFGLLVTQSDGQFAGDPRIVAIPLSTLLLLR